MSTSPTSEMTYFITTDQIPAFLFHKLHNYYEEKEFFDTVIKAGRKGVCIKAHRVVLCAFSEHFLNLIRQSRLTGNLYMVKLKEIEASTLKLIIDFMYSGFLELSLDNVVEILQAASFLKIESLIIGCSGVIEKNIGPSTSLMYIRLADELKLSGLKEKALEYINANLKEVSKTKEFLTMSEDELKDLLFSDSPRGNFEEEVFLAIMAWRNHDKLNREPQLCQLLSMVHFCDLTPRFIIENRKSVRKTVESNELMCTWLQWHFSPSTTRSIGQQNCASKTPEKLVAIQYRFFGKFDIQTFDPNLNSWSIELEAKHPSKVWFTSNSMIVINGKLFIVGGLLNASLIKNSVDCLDLHTSEWIDLPPMNKSRDSCQLSDLKGHLCAFGGDDDNKLISMELFNFSTRKWHDIQPPNQPSENARTAAHNGILYILDFSNGMLQIYDISSNSWTLKLFEDYPRRSYGLAAIEGFLYIFGGFYDGQIVKNVQRYNLSNETWLEMASLPQDHDTRYLKTTVFENKIIIGSSNRYDVDEYNIDTNTWNCLSPFATNDKHRHSDYDSSFCIFTNKIN